MLSLRINIARSSSEMDRIAPLWNELLQRQAHTIFQRFSWNRLAAETFRDHVTPHVVWMESKSGAAIIPAAINRASGEIELLGEALFDYRDVLHAGDGEVLHLVWQQMAASGRGLRVVLVEDPAARERWKDFPMSVFARAPYVDRARVDENTFRQAHPRLGRQMRRLNRLGISFRSYAGENSAVVRRLYECKRRHFAARDNLFLDQRRCDFMVAAAALEESCCDVFTMEKGDGALVAGLVSFRDGDVRRCYTIYFHPEWAHYSPGMTLLYEVTARSLAQKLSCDYMTGDYPYKMRLANSARRLYKVEVSARELAEIAARRISKVA